MITVKVTIAIPTYNRKSYLEQALDSIRKQTYSNIEIIVSDNHSDDGTEEFMLQYIKNHSTMDIIYYRQNENLGSMLNWENCLKKATGDYLTVLSDDDLLEPDAVRLMVAGMNDDVVTVIGNVIKIDADGQVIGASINPSGKLSCQDFWQGRLTGVVHDTPSAIMYRTQNGREAFAKVKGAGSAMDLAMCLLMSKDGYFNCIDYPVVKYRIHAGSDTNNIYRCASSHAALYQTMKKNDSSNVDLELLREYCINTIYSYAFRAILRQYDLSLMNTCIDLVTMKTFKISIGKARIGFFLWFLKKCMGKIIGKAR